MGKNKKNKPHGNKKNIAIKKENSSPKEVVAKVVETLVKETTEKVDEPIKEEITEQVADETIKKEISKKAVKTIKAEPTEKADETINVSDKTGDSEKKDVKPKNIFKGFSLKKAFSSITKTLDEKPDSDGNKDTDTVEGTNVGISEADNLMPNDKEDKPLLKVDNPFKRFFAKNTLTTISTALDEDVEEITLLSDNKPVAEEVATPSKKRLYNRRMYYIVGLSFTFMSIVGLIFSIGFCVNVVKRFTDNTAQKEKFAKYIYPLVVTDMPPYESVGGLSDEHVITTAIWDLIMYGDLDKYESNFDVITVPAIDIEQHATKLFGDNLTFNHKTFMASSINFYYDEEKKSYNIPTSPTYYSYIPQIEDIEKDGKKFTLLVAYKRDNPSWLTVREKESSNVSKYIEFVVLEEDNNYKILSMENVSSEHDVNSN